MTEEFCRYLEYLRRPSKAPQSMANDTIEVAGPEKLRFDELIRRLLSNNNDAREVTTDAHARYFGTELNDQSLVPSSSAPRIGSTRFESWLSRSTSRI
jgi:hypothetical protein